MGGAFPSSCGCTCDQATSQDLQPLVPSRWTGVGRRLQDPGADDCGAVWGAGDAGAAGGPGRGDGWPGKPGLILALVNDGAVGNVESRGSHSSLSFPLGPGALRAPRPGAWCIPASSLFCPGLGGAPEWVLLRGPRWGPGSPAAINSGVWVGRGQQHSRACEPPGPTDTCMSPPGPAPPRRPGRRPSPQGMRCPAPPTPQAGAEKQKSLLPCHPPSTLGSRPPAAGASPVTHTCIYSREMLHGQVPCAAQARSRLRSRPRGLRHQPRGWRPLVDNCCVSLWFVCPTPAERMPAPKEAGQCWGLGSLDEADVGGDHRVPRITD